MEGFLGLLILLLLLLLLLLQFLDLLVAQARLIRKRSVFYLLEQVLGLLQQIILLFNALT